jgi:hypothetical protein
MKAETGVDLENIVYYKDEAIFSPYIIFYFFKEYILGSLTKNFFLLGLLGRFCLKKGMGSSALIIQGSISPD